MALRGGRERVASILGCGQPLDDLPGEGGGENCPNCRTYQHCDKAEHGRNRVGQPKAGLCFRTNACPRCAWSVLPGVGAVYSAWWWSERPQGFTQKVGMDPPAVLMDAIQVYGSEVNRVRAYDIEHRPKGGTKDAGE